VKGTKLVVFLSSIFFHLSSVSFVAVICPKENALGIIYGVKLKMLFTYLCNGNKFKLNANGTFLIRMVLVARCPHSTACLILCR